MKKITVTISHNERTSTHWIKGDFQNVNYNALENKLHIERTPGTIPDYSYDFPNYDVSAAPFDFIIYYVVGITINSL